MQNSYILQSKNLTKKFRKQTALKNINLKIPSKEIYGLLGVNGAGKSTLMKIITGIVTSYSGKMFFNGKSWSRKNLKQIGALIEYPGAYSNLSAVDNMKIVALEEGFSNNRIKGTLKRLKIANTDKQKVGNFSLGMKQRLGIAMAMLKNPNFLILDEPFNGLDPYGIKELKAYLKNLTAQGKTILISSHILPEIKDIAQNIGILNQGSLVYQSKIKTGDDLEKIFFEKTQGKQ